MMRTGKRRCILSFLLHFLFGFRKRGLTTTVHKNKLRTNKCSKKCTLTYFFEGGVNSVDIECTYWWEYYSYKYFFAITVSRGIHSLNSLYYNVIGENQEMVPPFNNLGKKTFKACAHELLLCLSIFIIKKG